MVQPVFNRLLELLKGIFLLLEKKDKTIFQNKIYLYNHAKNVNLDEEQFRIMNRKIRLQFELIDLQIEDTLQEITSELYELKKEHATFEEHFYLFQSTTLKKVQSYLSIRPSSNETIKIIHAKTTKEEQIESIKKYLTTISKDTKYVELKEKLVRLFAQIRPQLSLNCLYEQGRIMKNKEILQELLEFEYEQDSIQENLYKEYFSFFVFVYTGIILEEVNVYPARKVIPSTKDSGFQATAYEVKHNNIKEVYFIFKGTESSFRSFKSTVSDVLNRNFINEAFTDWKYNLESVVLGTGKSQVTDGIKFVRTMMKHIKSPHCYAAGHSLGGHLVQTIHIIDRPFEEVYTINSSPVQARQIYNLKPHLFSSKRWKMILEKEELDNNWPTSNNQYINDLLGCNPEMVINESFQLDFTRILTYFHGAVHIGTTNYYSLPLENYPLDYELRKYFTQEDLLYLYEIVEEILEMKMKNESILSITKVFFSLINKKNKLDSTAAYKKSTINFMLKLLNFAEITEVSDRKEISKNREALLATLPQECDCEETVKKKQLSTLILSLKNNFSFMFSHNKETTEMISYLHGIAGGKWAVRLGKLGG